MIPALKRQPQALRVQMSIAAQPHAVAPEQRGRQVTGAVAGDLDGQKQDSFPLKVSGMAFTGPILI